MPVSLGQAQRDAKENFSSNSDVISLTLTLCFTSALGTTKCSVSILVQSLRHVPTPKMLSS